MTKSFLSQALCPLLLAKMIHFLDFVVADVFICFYCFPASKRIECFARTGRSVANKGLKHVRQSTIINHHLLLLLNIYLAVVFVVNLPQSTRFDPVFV